MPISLGWVDTGEPDTTLDLIAATRRHLYGRERTALNLIAADISDTTETVTFSQPFQQLAAGATLCVGLEEMRVWTADPSLKSCTVLRGYNGSTAVAHFAGDLVEVNPVFSNWEIFDAINQDLRSLSAPGNGLYAIRTLDITAVSGRLGYDFPVSDFSSVAEIQWQVPNTQTQEWRELNGFSISEDLPTTAFPSGTALFINDRLPTANQTIRIRYKARFTPLVALTDAVETTGLPETAFDLPPLGAAVRLAAGRPMARADYTRQGDTKRATEVRVQEIVQAPAALRALRQSRVNEEAARLSVIWPPKVRARITL